MFISGKYPVLIALCTIVCLLACSCHTDVKYHTYQEVPLPWKRQDTLSFKFPNEMTSAQYSMEIEIRHTENYPFRDLWIAVRHPLIPALTTDTFHLYLANTDGSWKGSGRTLIQFSSPHHSLYLQEGDSVIQIIHLMEQSPLNGIEDIGLRLLPGTGSINSQKDKK